MNLELGGKLPKAVGRNDSLGNLPSLFLRCRKIRFFVVAGLLLTQKNVEDGFHVAVIKIQEGGVLIELHLEGIDDVVEANSRRHRFETIILPRSVEGAVQTVAGYEAMHAIRKGQIRWLATGDVVGQVQFIQRILGIAA